MVSIITAKPTEEFEGKISASFESEHDESQSLLVLSGPISDNVLGRLTVSTREMDGWIFNEHMNRVELERDETYVRGWITSQSSDTFCSIGIFKDLEEAS